MLGDGESTAALSSFNVSNFPLKNCNVLSQLAGEAWPQIAALQALEDACEFGALLP